MNKTDSFAKKIVNVNTSLMNHYLSCNSSNKKLRKGNQNKNSEEKIERKNIVGKLLKL
jgi:hypothetical protein